MCQWSKAQRVGRLQVWTWPVKAICVLVSRTHLLTSIYHSQFCKRVLRPARSASFLRQNLCKQQAFRQPIWHTGVYLTFNVCGFPQWHSLHAQPLACSGHLPSGRAIKAKEGLLNGSGKCEATCEKCLRVCMLQVPNSRAGLDTLAASRRSSASSSENRLQLFGLISSHLTAPQANQPLHSPADLDHDLLAIHVST